MKHSTYCCARPDARLRVDELEATKYSFKSSENGLRKWDRQTYQMSHPTPPKLEVLMS